MKLENKFYNAFFYPFLIGIIFSILIVALILSYYLNNYLDKKTAQYIFKMHKKQAGIIINSVNVFLYNVLLKIQIGLQEQMTFYLNLASKTTDFSKSSIGKNVYNAINVEKESIETNNDYASIWFIDKKKTIIENKNSIIYKQISIFSQLTQSLYSVYSSMNDVLMNIYFLFEETNLFIIFPYLYFKNGLIKEFQEYNKNPTWCTDENGKKVNYYKFKCREFYIDMMKSKEDMFDLNVHEQPDRRIFVIPPYKQLGLLDGQIIFSLCIQFNDTISKKNAYICADINGKNLFDSFDIFNERIFGYFSITSIGFNRAFYFPQMFSLGYGKNLGEYIFRWDRNYYLEEKLDFFNIIQNNMTSNYYTHINRDKIQNDPIHIFDEIIIDNSSGEEQRFYFNEEKINYCIFPILFQNNETNYEHTLSIIYLFNKKYFYENMLEYQSNLYSQLILQLIFFIFFGIVILYLIVLSLRLLAKFIVIPIKNVLYMLKGINIGGEYRLEYLDNLKKKQEENLEKLNKINQQIMQKKPQKNENNNLNNEKEKERNNENFLQKSTIKSILLDNDKENDEKRIPIVKNKALNNININTNTNRENEKLLNIPEIINEQNTDTDLEYNGELINPKINYDKLYDLENDIIEKEYNFYDFDEELLQYRPIEIDQLVRAFLNLRNALLLTSSNNEVENIIDYSNCDYIFNNFKNEEGSRMCQSNIGNLQSQLLKYDKAIYHLALSLQNIELKKYLSQTLSDELDENDSLLHKIEMNYNKNVKEKEINKLAKRQQNSKHKNFSQKTIGILINSRYNKLIHIYFKFFKHIQKSNYNYEKLSGCFMHTRFHTINYYHKMLIQYVFLCFVSNDLVKLGESILDYIEFLIKFKLKTSEENKIVLNINNKEFPEIKQKQNIKKKYFNKLVSWFNLFENYAKQINENSALGNCEGIVNSYAQNFNLNNNELDSENQSALLFQINLQRSDFLKGKFALACENYSDAIGYLISAAKKKRIVIDGLIKKRALKHIFKIAEKTGKIINNNNYKNLNFYESIMGLKNKNITKLNMIKSGLNGFEEVDFEENKNINITDKMRIIMEYILDDINECNEKQLKDIIILIDFNYADKLTVDSYIDVTKTILKNYLTNNDRIGVFLLVKENRIICPMMRKCEIDILNFSKDLDKYSNKLFNKERLDSSFGNEVIQKQLERNESESSKNSQDNNLSFSSDNFEQQKKENTITFEMSIEDTIKSLNYCIYYLKMKEINTNEKYFIFFNTNINKIMDYLLDVNDNIDLESILNDSSENQRIELQIDKKIHFLLVGRVNSSQNESEIYKKVLLQYFGSKSEMIPFDNMKKIKSILSSNSIINDNIIFPNEVYK